MLVLEDLRQEWRLCQENRKFLIGVSPSLHEKETIH